MSSPRSREPITLLVFAASLRAGSVNTTLASLAAARIEANGAAAVLTTMDEFDCPSYSRDLQDGEGMPAGAVALRERLELCDGFVIASPEFNASMPGVLKNTIDWASRFNPKPFNELDGLLLSASTSLSGGNRGLWALRVPFEYLGARIYPDMFSLALAHEAFDGDGQLVDPRLRERFEENVVSFLDVVEAHKHYLPTRRAWREQLGEQPDAVIEQAE
jgi:chromate reductase, NAD(P)H dehydrogenase (quinone)